MRIKSNLPVLLLVFAAIFIDQASKLLVSRFFNVACNANGAFGLTGNFGLISALVLIVVFWLLVQEKNRIGVFGLALVFGGGVSNLVDRFVVGCVRDFINLGFFPSFNLADSLITIGAAIVLFNFVFGGKTNDEV